MRKAMNAFSIVGRATVVRVLGDGAADAFGAVAQPPREHATSPRVMHQSATPNLSSREVFIVRMILFLCSL